MLPENWDAVRVFIAAQTQWNHGPSGHLVGLPYPAVEAVARGLDVAFAAIFEGLRVMEAEILNLASAAAERAGPVKA